MATKENHLTYNFAPFPKGLKSSHKFLQALKIPPNQMFSTIRSVVCRLECHFNRHRTSLLPNGNFSIVQKGIMGTNSSQISCAQNALISSFPYHFILKTQSDL